MPEGQADKHCIFCPDVELESIEMNSNVPILHYVQLFVLEQTSQPTGQESQL